jgi:transcription elongation factor Elf1
MNCPKCNEKLIEHSQLIASRSMKGIIIYNLCEKCGQRFDLLGKKITASQIKEMKDSLDRLLA